MRVPVIYSNSHALADRVSMEIVDVLPQDENIEAINSKTKDGNNFFILYIVIISILGHAKIRPKKEIYDSNILNFLLTNFILLNVSCLTNQFF